MTKRIKVINLKCSSFEFSRNCSRRLRVEDWQAKLEREGEIAKKRDLFLFIERLKLASYSTNAGDRRKKKWRNSDGFEKKQRKALRDLSQTYRNLVFIEALTVSLPT